MFLTRTKVTGNHHVYSKYLEVMIPKYVTGNKSGRIYEWCEEDLVYYSNDERYVHYGSDMVHPSTKKELNEWRNGERD